MARDSKNIICGQFKIFDEPTGTGNPLGKMPYKLIMSLAGQLYGKNQNNGVSEKMSPPMLLPSK